MRDKGVARSTCSRAEPGGRSTTRDRNLQLDLLRCAAILGVLVAHTTIFRRPKWWWDRLAITPSWTGVDLFFVISGFLITWLLLREADNSGRVNLKQFYIRRSLRILPVYLTFLATLGLLQLLTPLALNRAGWLGSLGTDVSRRSGTPASTR